MFYGLLLNATACFIVQPPVLTGMSMFYIVKTTLGRLPHVKPYRCKKNDGHILIIYDENQMYSNCTCRCRGCKDTYCTLCNKLMKSQFTLTFQK